MARKKRYHLTQREDGKWQVKMENSARASIVADTKNEALRKGIALAKSQPESQLIIHKADGSIQEERTYGSDPSRTPG